MKGRIYLILFFCMAIAISCIGYNAFRNNKKVAYIASNKVFDDFLLKKELEADLKKVQLYKQTYLDSLKLKIQTISVKEGSRTKEDLLLMDELKKMYLLKENNFNQESEYLFQEYNDKIWKQLNQYIEDFGKEFKYDYLFGTSGQGNLMYAGETENVTAIVTKYVNEKYAGKQKH